MYVCYVMYNFVCGIMNSVVYIHTMYVCEERQLNTCDGPGGWVNACVCMCE